jgi:hypothetical protein
MNPLAMNLSEGSVFCQTSNVGSNWPVHSGFFLRHYAVAISQLFNLSRIFVLQKLATLLCFGERFDDRH